MLSETPIPFFPGKLYLIRVFTFPQMIRSAEFYFRQFLKARHIKNYYPNNDQTCDATLYAHGKL